MPLGMGQISEKSGLQAENINNSAPTTTISKQLSCGGT